MFWMCSVSSLKAAMTLQINISDRAGQSALYWSRIKARWFLLKKLPWHGPNPPVSFPTLEKTVRGTVSNVQTLRPGQTHTWYSALGSRAGSPPGKYSWFTLLQRDRSVSTYLKAILKFATLCAAVITTCCSNKTFYSKPRLRSATGLWAYHQECDGYHFQRPVLHFS